MSSHICFFIDTHVMGGAEQYVMDLMEGMRRKGYRISIICHDFSDLIHMLQKRWPSKEIDIYPYRFPSITRTARVQGGLAKNRALGGRFNLLKIPGLFLYYVNMLRSYWPIRKRLRSIKPDIFHISAGGYPAGESYRTAVFAAASLKIPRRVMTVHNQAPKPPMDFPELWLDRLVEKNLHAITTASFDAKEALVGNRHFASSHIRVIPYGIQPLTTPGPSREVLRQQLHLPLNSIVIGTLGALQPRKGHAFLLSVFEAIAGDHPTLHLVIIGSGSCQQELETQIQKMRHGDRVHLAGYRSDAKTYLSAMDIFAFPSLAYECLPYAVLEAMQAALPIVASRVGGIREEIESGPSGLLATPGEASSWKEALSQLLKDKGLSQRLAHNAQQRVHQTFSITRMMEETEQLYA